jgi:outer membrane receptor protein involved in Fe transport
LLSSSAFVLFSGAAFAEENTSQPASEADNSAAGAEIVVTGQGHGAEVQNAPVSITSLSATDIAKKNLVEPGDLARAVPGLTVSEIGTTRNSARYTLRGQNQETGADPSVVTYFGGVATSSPGPGFLFDLAGVDVYKGPQGTSFGRGVTGGAVVLMPNEPGQTYGGYLEASGAATIFVAFRAPSTCRSWATRCWRALPSISTTGAAIPAISLRTNGSMAASMAPIAPSSWPIRSRA